MVANACWELSLGALKTFIVLYVTAGLGYSLGQASVIIGGVAVLVLGGALVSGKLADRHGGLRVMRVGLWVYGIGLLVPALTRTPAILLPALPVIAAGGGMIMGLPYALLIPLMPEGDHGALTGVYSLSRGVGTMLGPLLAGFVIEIAGPLYPSTNGYGAMWLVVAGAILASIPVLGRLRRSREDRRELQSGAEDRAPRRSGDAQARASEA
jgi:MFS family permease